MAYELTEQKSKKILSLNLMWFVYDFSFATSFFVSCNSLAKIIYPLLVLIWVGNRMHKTWKLLLIWNSLRHPFLDSFVCLFVVCRSWVRPDWLWFILFVSWCHLVLWQRFARSWKRENSLPFCILGDIPTFESDFGFVLLCVSCFGW